MRKKILFYSLIVMAALGIFTSAASAMGGGWFGMGQNLDPDKLAEIQTARFAHQAEVLGVSVDQVKNYWAEGKDMQDIIKELNLDQTAIQAKIKDTRLSNMKSELQSLVGKGVITQDQADKRLEFMSQNNNLGPGGMMGRGRGMHGMMGEHRPFAGQDSDDQNNQ